jgi:hypothetical protein
VTLSRSRQGWRAWSRHPPARHRPAGTRAMISVEAAAEFPAHKRIAVTAVSCKPHRHGVTRCTGEGLLRRLGGSGEPVPGGHAAGVGPDQCGPGRKAGNTFRHDRDTEKGQGVPCWSVMGCWAVTLMAWTAGGRQCPGLASVSSRRLVLGTSVRRCREVPRRPARRMLTSCCSIILGSAVRSCWGFPPAAARCWSSGCATRTGSSG